jgi:Zn-dependent protease with chaperone function
MDFFEHQELARKSTQNLLFLFVAAVVGIVGAVYLVIVTAWQLSGERASAPFTLWEPRVLLWTAPGVLAVIGLGSLWKTVELRGGGAVVAKRLGGRPIDLQTTDPHERRALNVVQEMALASGVPVPDVYLLEDEHGINAFAAGFTGSDAVIGVTRGAITKLSRDELQGMMGHEFSHVLNGDMRLNLRLMAVVHGILLIALLGRGLMRGSRRGRKKGAAQAALIGFGLFLIGYVGVFFANLIKAAVSRQREFLADASAVQFTRNPSGVAGVLLKIGGLSSGSRLVSARADEASHMFFGDGKVHRLTAAMATHPPLAERIQRIDPSWNGAFPALDEGYVALAGEEAEQAAGAFASAAGLAGAAAFADTAPAPATRAWTARLADAALPPPRTSALDRIGRPGPEHLERARALWDGAPEPLREAARHPDRVVALAYALLLAPAGPERARQIAVVQRDDAPASEAVAALLPAAGELDPEARLPLLEVAASALGALPPERYVAFSRTVRDLVEGDRQVELTEWMLSRLLLRHLRERLEPARTARSRYRAIGAFPDEASVLLSVLAHAGHDDAAGAERAFAAGAREVGLGGVSLRPPDGCPPRALESALDTFALLFPEEKRRLVAACAASVAADDHVHPREAELFRVVSDWLGAPVPPLLPGQLLA